MRRRLLAACLVMCLVLSLLWQSFAAAGAAWSAARSQDLAHAALHWLEEGHHHHDDGSYHEDDSAESLQHLMADGSTPASALPAAGWASPPAIGSPSPGITADSIGPPPYIDGPRRPPRSAA
jgi:hypothetical protein